jgi:hypothetical protein
MRIRISFFAIRRDKSFEIVRPITAAAECSRKDVKLDWGTGECGRAAGVVAHRTHEAVQAATAQQLPLLPLSPPVRLGSTPPPAGAQGRNLEVACREERGAAGHRRGTRRGTPAPLCDPLGLGRRGSPPPLPSSRTPCCSAYSTGKLQGEVENVVRRWGRTDGLPRRADRQLDGWRAGHQTLQLARARAHCAKSR